MLSPSIMLLWPGIDVSDQMTDHYSAELGTVKCWRNIVFHLFDRTVTNACIPINLASQGLLPTLGCGEDPGSGWSRDTSKSPKMWEIFN